MWNVQTAMKTASLVCPLAVVSFLLVTNSPAQSARQLTRRIVTPANNPSSANAAPAAKPAPVSSVAPATNNTAVPAPPPPADAEKAKQETLRKTVEFERKRAEGGTAWAQYSLGVRYLTGDGVEKNEADARKWLEEAAKNDDTRAKKKLEELNEKKKK